MSGSKNKEGFTNGEIRKQLLNIAEETFSDETEVTMGSTKSETVGWDSLGNLNLIMAVEDEFNVELSEKELENTKSIEYLYDTILGKIDD